MKNLILVRHAKSDWSLSLDDFDRTLTDRGKSDAMLIAGQVDGILPRDYTVWSSSARRAAATAEIMTKVWNFPQSKIEFDIELYTFSGSKLEPVIKSCADDIDSLIVFGHNEAITDFVNNFGDIYIDNVPTSGLVWITFSADRWRDIGGGKTIRTAFPKLLR